MLRLFVYFSIKVKKFANITIRFSIMQEVFIKKKNSTEIMPNARLYSLSGFGKLLLQGKFTDN